MHKDKQVTQLHCIEEERNTKEVLTNTIVQSPQLLKSGGIVTPLPTTDGAHMTSFKKLSDTAGNISLVLAIRRVVTAAAGAIGVALITSPCHADAVPASAAKMVASAAPGADDIAIRPFRSNFPQSALDDLRKRLLATRWPDKETVSDQSQGVQLAKLQELVRYWGSEYDWHKGEARLNAFPQFKTRIDGLDIHFIHVRSRHANALPLIITHGWPGSVFEQSSSSVRLLTRQSTAAGPRTRST